MCIAPKPKGDSTIFANNSADPAWNLSKDISLRSPHPSPSNQVTDTCYTLGKAASAATTAGKLRHKVQRCRKQAAMHDKTLGPSEVLPSYQKDMVSPQWGVHCKVSAVRSKVRAGKFYRSLLGGRRSGERAMTLAQAESHEQAASARMNRSQCHFGHLGLSHKARQGIRRASEFVDNITRLVPVHPAKRVTRHRTLKQDLGNIGAQSLALALAKIKGEWRVWVVAQVLRKATEGDTHIGAA
jgi:hypothetical protein